MAFPKPTRASLPGIPVQNSTGALAIQQVVVGNGWNDVVSLPELTYVPELRTLLSWDAAARVAGTFEYPGWSSQVTFQSTGIGSEGRSALDTWVESGGAGSVLCGYFGGYFDRGSAAFGTNIGVGLSGYNFLTATNARTINSLFSGQFTTELSCTNVTIGTIKGMEMQAAINYGGAGAGNTIATAYAAHCLDNNVGAGATITLAYGLKVEDITSATTNVALQTGTGRHILGDAVSIGSNAVAAASAILDLTSTTKGMLLPRMTTAQRDAIGTPTAGLLIYNSTTGKLNFRAAAAWEAVTSV